MTIFAWIMTILFILVLALSLLLWHITKDDVDLSLNTMLSLVLTIITMLFTTELSEKSTTEKINSQYHPKTKVTITSDSTYHIDTLYYIKVKPKTK